ncbi:MAG: redox-sensitive bicupin YhaK, pirin superfamily [Chlorobi bacterium]|nr:redox-sensitive bicupin YhaK, pirin superfamily [Chlorobiota bacterium]
MITLHRSGDTSAGFRALLGVEEIRLAPDEEIPLHTHVDVEIITYVLEGSVGHQDALNNGTIIFPGDIHRATAGRGISHTEFNNSESEAARYLQISITPESLGMIPGYEQRMFIEEEAAGRWLLIASRDGRGDTVTIHQDAGLYAAVIEAGEGIDIDLDAGRAGWLRVLRGAIRLNGELLADGDVAEIIDAPGLHLIAADRAELLLFDLA